MTFEEWWEEHKEFSCEMLGIDDEEGKALVRRFAVLAFTAGIESTKLPLLRWICCNCDGEGTVEGIACLSCGGVGKAEVH